MTSFRRLVPAPLLSAALLAMWVALSRAAGPSEIVSGIALGVGLPLLTSRLRPTAIHVRRPLAVVRFIVRVGRDVLVSNVHVAWGVLAWRWRKPNPRFVIIPLDLRAPAGIAALAMVTTVVPGTVWSELALDRSALMLHVWDVDEEAAFVGRFKARYEKPLREIFE